MRLMTYSSSYDESNNRYSYYGNLWDGRTGEQVAQLSWEGGYIDVDFSPDGSRLATSGDNVRLWDGEMGDLIAVLEGFQAVFSPDGTRLATASSDGTRLWDGRTGDLIAVLEGSQAVFSPDGTRLMTYGFSRDGNDRYSYYGNLWDGRTGEQVAQLTWESGESSQLIWVDGYAENKVSSFSPDGSRLVTVGDDARLWDGRTGDLVAILGGHTDTIKTLAFSPDGAALLTGQWTILDYRGWTFLALIGFFYGILAGFQTRLVETKTKPNQGMYLTARNALTVALCFGGLALIAYSSYAMDEWNRIYDVPLRDAIALIGFGFLKSLILPSGIVAGLVFLGYGGLDVIYHYILRLLLVLRSHTPWRYTRFLDHAAERVFLQKVGGGYYIFIHRLLLEYFASLDEKEKAALAGVNAPARQ
jgi:dipeptidyl aminopeptidase/acylaminoacyl peptidase